MEQYDGLLRLAGEFSPPIRVTIDLTDEGEMRIGTDEVEIGHWPIDQLAVKAQDDGFHVVSDGEELVITTDDDPRFAVALGIRNAPAQLRRQISALMRNDPRFHPNDQMEQPAEG